MSIHKATASHLAVISNPHLKSSDPLLASLLAKEGQRQRRGLEMIASENFTYPSVLECLGSLATNKYSEGLPGRRYYGGNTYIDQIETLCQKRALEVFGLSPVEWGVNVQPYSGSIANLAAYNAILEPHNRIMGLGLPSGGHLTHGFYTKKKKVSATSVFYESLAYEVGEDGYIDYDALERDAKKFLPNLIICGYSAYPRDLDYSRFRAIADAVGACLLCDMSHFSGFVAAGLLESPFSYCDLVTTTTHKTLRGPRSAMIFGRQKYMDAINASVFPGIQGGPHNHQIAGVATALLEASTPEFRIYMERVRENARVLSEALKDKGYEIMTGGTDNHLILVNLRLLGITGSKVERLCDEVDITLNKNAVPGDTSALSPGGIRIGTPALTTLGMGPEEMKAIASFLNHIITLGCVIQKKSGKKMVDFVEEMERHREWLNNKKANVHALASRFT